MAQSEYASLRPFTTNVSISSQSGGSLSAGSFYFWVQARSRCGYNLLSDGAEAASSNGRLISWSAGDKIVITFNTGAWLVGEDIFEFAVSASAAAEPATARILALVRTRDSATIGTESYLGVGAPLSLPLRIELTEDEHVSLGAFIAEAIHLPSNPVHGMVRYVQDQEAYWKYDELASDGFVSSGQGFWVGHSTGFSQYVSDISQGAILDVQVQGYARPIAQISSGVQSDEVLASPPYLFDNSLENPNYATQFIISNRDGASPISSGTRIEVRWYRNAENVSTIFSGLAIATLMGKVDLATGLLDVTADGVGTPIVLGASISGTGGISTPEDLDIGHGWVYRIQLQADATAITTPDSPLANGDIITFYPKVEGAIGERVALAAMVGQAVSPVGDRMMVLPSTGTAKATMGSGSLLSLDEARRHGHLSPYTAQRDIIGIVPSTDGQVVAFNAAFNSVRIRSTDAELKSYEEKRAEIGTGIGPLSGYYSASDWVSVAIAGNSERIELSIVHADYIRTTYPDEQIAGQVAPLNAPEFTIYVRFEGVIYHLFTASVLASPQQINITDIGSSTVASVPDSRSNPKFGLFGYGPLTVLGTANPSTLATGTYEVAIAYKYDGSQVTQISHNADDGCIQVRAVLTEAASFSVENSYLWQAAQRYAPVVLNSVLGMVSIDLRESNLYTLTLTENVTAIDVNNVSAGIDAKLEIINPDGYTVGGWAGAIAWVGGSAPTAPADWAIYEMVSFDGATIRATEWGSSSISAPDPNPDPAVTATIEPIVIDSLLIETVTAVPVTQDPTSTNAIALEPVILFGFSPTSITVGHLAGHIIFDDAIAINSFPFIDSSTLNGSYGELGEPSHNGDTPGGIDNLSVWWQLTPTATADYLITAFLDDDYYSAIGIYTGSTVNALTQVASGETAVQTALNSGITYHIAVSTSNANSTAAIAFSIAEIVTLNNDNFADAFAISSLPYLVSVSSINSTGEAGEPAHAGGGNGDVDSRSLWWTYTPNVNQSIKLSTLGSKFDTVLAIYTGTAVNALNEIDSNDETDSGFDSTSQIDSVGLTAGTTYYIAIDGYQGDTGTILLSVTEA